MHFYAHVLAATLDTQADRNREQPHHQKISFTVCGANLGIKTLCTIPQFSSSLNAVNKASPTPVLCSLQQRARRFLVTALLVADLVAKLLGVSDDGGGAWERDPMYGAVGSC